MWVRYCCNPDIYQMCYLDQVGNVAYSAGFQRQRGYGIGSIFGSIGKAVLPLLKKGAKTVGKQVLKSSLGFAFNVLQGKRQNKQRSNEQKRPDQTSCRASCKIASVQPNRKKEYKSEDARKTTTFSTERIRTWLL